MKRIYFKKIFMLAMLSCLIANQLLASPNICLDKILYSKQISKADFIKCIDRLKSNKENAEAIISEILNELSKDSDYNPKVNIETSAGEVFIDSDFKEKPKKHHRFFAIKEIIRELLNSNFIDQQFIKEKLCNTTNFTILKILIQKYGGNENGFIEFLAELFIEDKFSTEYENHLMRQILASRIGNYNSSDKIDLILDYTIKNHNEELRMIVNTIYYTKKKNNQLPEERRTKLVRNLLNQLEVLNSHQSYLNIQTIERISNLKFINQYFRYRDRQKHYENSKRKALKYYKENFL